MANDNSLKQGGLQQFVRRVLHLKKQPKATAGLPAKVSETLVAIAQDDVETVLRSLHSSPSGLSTQESQRRIEGGCVCV